MSPLFQSYLVLFNIAKKSNFGHLIRTANAFSVSEVLIVGKRSYHEFGAFGTTRGIGKRHFYSLDEACRYLRSKNCAIAGIELTDSAVPITGQPFQGSTGFLIGNEGQGLSPQQLACCDSFVYVPQYGTAASLNVNVAAGIVLHHFAVWAQFVENDRHAGKCVRP